MNSVSVTWKSQAHDSCPPDLRLLHFNDVYHIEYASNRQGVVMHVFSTDVILELALRSPLGVFRVFSLS